MKGMSAFGVWLKTSLQERGMLQRDLAKELGITEAAVSRFIHGDREPRGFTMQRIMDIFDCHIVFDRNENPAIQSAGKWIPESTLKSAKFRCSECGELVYYYQSRNVARTGKQMPYKFCPYCRSPMHWN